MGKQVLDMVADIAVVAAVMAMVRCYVGNLVGMSEVDMVLDILVVQSPWFVGS